MRLFEPLKRKALVMALSFGFAVQALATAPSPTYEFVRAGVYDQKCKLALEVGPTPLDQLSRHLHMTPSTLGEALELFQKSAAWPTTEALFIYGSRAHKYWGNKYDLDVLFLPYEGSVESTRLDSHQPEVEKYSAQYRVVLDTRDFVTKNNFRIDVGNANGKTLRSLLAKNQLMTSLKEALFLSRVAPPLARAREIADRAAGLLPSDLSGKAQIQDEINIESRNGNPFFRNPHLSLKDFPALVSAGYRVAAAKMGLEGPFLTTKSPILLKAGPSAANLTKQLKRRGYTFIYLINEDGSLSFSPTLEK